MSRYIDAEWLKAVYEIKPKRGEAKGGYLIPIPFIFECIEKAPSIDIDRPQGEWIESFKSVETRQGAYLGTKFVHDGWSCSECSEVVEKRYPNCPYCLARMKGADDE